MKTKLFLVTATEEFAGQERLIEFLVRDKYISNAIRQATKILCSEWGDDFEISNEFDISYPDLGITIYNMSVSQVNTKQAIDHFVRK